MRRMRSIQKMKNLCINCEKYEYVETGDDWRCTYSETFINERMYVFGQRPKVTNVN